MNPLQMKGNFSSCVSIFLVAPMGTGNKQDGSPKSVRVPSPYAVWGGG